MSSIRVDFTNITAIREEIIWHAQAIGLLEEKGEYKNPSSGDPEQKLTPGQLEYLHTLFKFDLTPITTRAEQLIDYVSRLPQLQRTLDPVYFFAPTGSKVPLKVSLDDEKSLDRVDIVEKYKTAYLGRTISDDKVKDYDKQRNQDFKKIQTAREKWGTYQILACTRGSQQISKLKAELKTSSLRERERGFGRGAEQAAEKNAVDAFRTYCEHKHIKDRRHKMTPDEQLLEEVVNLIRYTDVLYQLQEKFKQTLEMFGEKAKALVTTEDWKRASWGVIGRDLETFVRRLASINDQIVSLEKVLSAELNQTIPAIEPANVTLQHVKAWRVQLSAWLEQTIVSSSIEENFRWSLVLALRRNPDLTFTEWAERHPLKDYRNEQFAEVLFEQFKLMYKYQPQAVDPTSVDFAKVLEVSKQAVRDAELEMRLINFSMVQPSFDDAKGSEQVTEDSVQEDELDTRSRTQSAPSVHIAKTLDDSKQVAEETKSVTRSHSVVQPSTRPRARSLVYISKPYTQAVSRQQTSRQFLSKFLAVFQNNWRKILLFGLVSAGFAAFCVATFGAGLGVGAGIGIAFAALVGSSAVTAGGLACFSKSQQRVKAVDISESGLDRRRSSSSGTVISALALVDIASKQAEQSQPTADDKCHPSPTRRSVSVAQGSALVTPATPSNRQRRSAG